MDRNIRQVINDEFARYRHFFVRAIYKPLTPRRHPLDWFIMNMMYRDSDTQQREGLVARKMRHFYRTLRNPEGVNIHVFMTQVIEVVKKAEGGYAPFTTLHWKYSLTGNPLDVIETSVDCSSVLDKFVPVSISRSVQPDDGQVKRITESRAFSSGFKRRLSKLLSICRRRRDKK